MTPTHYSVGPDFGGGMQFVLTYDGTLHGTSDPLRQHAIRRTLHPQLLKQWTLEKTLVRIAQTTGVDNIASGFSFGGFRFVPLVTRRLDLVCRLEIMLLRPEEPGNVAYTSGAQLGRRGTFPDTDNRIGVLFDALAVPKPDQVKPGMVPDASEDPFYCLVEDD